MRSENLKFTPILVRVLDLRSTGRGIESWSTRCRVQPGQIFNTCFCHQSVSANGWSSSQLGR